MWSFRWIPYARVLTRTSKKIRNTELAEVLLNEFQKYVKKRYSDNFCNTFLFLVNPEKNKEYDLEILIESMKGFKENFESKKEENNDFL